MFKLLIDSKPILESTSNETLIVYGDNKLGASQITKLAFINSAAVKIV